jgi:hypothetical protein
MIKNIIVLLTFTAFHASAMDLFKAEYTVFKDGKKIGQSSTELSMDAPFYVLTDKTNGTHGMASFLGFKRTEKTLFTESDNVFVPESYKMDQKVAFKKRQSDYQVDSENKMAYGKHKGKDWQISTPETFTTPNLVALNLSQDICAGNTSDLIYTLVKDGKIKKYQFTITSEKDGIIEIDKVHSKPSRVTKTWLDKNQHCLPIKTYHIEEGEEPLETKLIKMTFN